MGEVWFALLVIVAVIMLAIIIGFVWIKAEEAKIANKPVGNLYVVDTPEDGSQLYLEVTGCSMGYLRKRKWVKFTVIDKGSLR